MGPGLDWGSPESSLGLWGMSDSAGLEQTGLTGWLSAAPAKKALFCNLPNPQPHNASGKGTEQRVAKQRLEGGGSGRPR